MAAATLDSHAQGFLKGNMRLSKTCTPDELVEQFVNGNQSHVLKTIGKLKGKNAAAIVLEMVSLFDETNLVKFKSYMIHSADFLYGAEAM